MDRMAEFLAIDHEAGKTPHDDDPIIELADRLRRASSNLRTIAQRESEGVMRDEAIRLEGKAQGVDLALSYVEEILRERKP